LPSTAHPRSRGCPICSPDAETLSATRHLPVLRDEVLAALQPRAGGRYIDGTLGGGGHTTALLERSEPDGRVLALDADPEPIGRAAALRERFGDRLTLIRSNFRDLDSVAQAQGFAPCDGVLLDLGISSDQLAEAERGFSLQADGPLDMRFDISGGESAAELLNTSDETELADIFYHYGEERRSRRLARLVVARRQERPFVRTGDLVAVAEAALGPRRGRIHPATRVFQALRIAVNDELGALESALSAAVSVLAPGGRLAVISFHSLEDRIVKQFIRSQSVADEEPRLRPLTRKPQTAGPAELAANPRSRSAKLRVAERLAPMTMSGA
jgi:16S rRNA (cytosine1402-N4)-methyltransferase